MLKITDNMFARILRLGYAIQMEHVNSADGYVISMMSCDMCDLFAHSMVTNVANIIGIPRDSELIATRTDSGYDRMLITTAYRKDFLEAWSNERI